MYSNLKGKKGILYAVCRATTIYALEISRKPLDKIAHIKLINDIGFSYSEELNLPAPLYPNPYIYGPLPIDVNRWRYEDNYLIMKEKTIDIPDANGLRAEILEECEETLGRSRLNLIRELVRRIAILRGKRFSAWILFRGEWETTYVSLGEIQIEEFILRRSKNRLNWVINPKFLEYVSQRRTTRKIKVGNIIEFSSGDSTIHSEKLEAIKICDRELNGMIKEKKVIFKRNEGWRFRINKIYKKRGLELYSLDGKVLYIGRIVHRRNKWFIVDTYYTTRECDYVPIEPFEGIENIHSPCIAVIGKIKVENGELSVFPIGILKLL